VDGDRESGRTGGGKKLLKYKKIEKKKKKAGFGVGKRIWTGSLHPRPRKTTDRSSRVPQQLPV
jgi:hypothetical protein